MRSIHRRPALARWRVRSRGLSLVELLVGVAIGLFITAAATMLVSSQLSSNRQLLVETQIEQDLRATADIVARDLRRASFAYNADTFANFPDSVGAPEESWARNVTLSAGPGVSTQVNYQYARGSNTAYGLRVTADGVLQRGLSRDFDLVWQPLTDAAVLRITEFSVTPAQGGNDITEQVACPTLCADGTTACWPVVAVRELRIIIKGQSATGTPVRREIDSRVRVRNDVVRFNGAPGRVCP